MMKFLLYTIAFVATFTFLNAQSLEMVTFDEKKGGLETDFEIKAYAQFTNVTEETHTYKVKIDVVNLPFGMYYSFCDKNTCYEPSNEMNWEAALTFDLTSGETPNKEESALYIYPFEIKGKATLTVTIQNVDDEDDNLQYTVDFYIGVSSVPFAVIRDARIGPAFPNPSSGDFQFNINLPATYQNAELQIFDVNGVTIRQQSIDNLNGNVNVHLDNVSSGAYFYSVQVDGMRSEPKTILINK